jgi:mannosyltransferase OCH1-like enzyme
VLRVAILYKFGGTYMDTDIITLGMHPSVDECPNFVNFEEPGSINGAMMRFSAKHPMLEVIGERLCNI